MRFENKLLHTPHKAERGRPVKDDAMTVFNKVCVDLTSGDNEMYTLKQLHDMMLTMTDDVDCEVYTSTHLQQMLKQRYGDHLFHIKTLSRRYSQIQRFL